MPGLHLLGNLVLVDHVGLSVLSDLKLNQVGQLLLEVLQLGTQVLEVEKENLVRSHLEFLADLGLGIVETVVVVAGLP